MEIILRVFKFTLLTVIGLGTSLNAQKIATQADEVAVRNKTQQFSNQENIGFIENKGRVYDQNNNYNPSVKYLLNLNGLNVALKSIGFSYDAWVSEDLGEDESRRKAMKIGESVPHKYNYKFHRIDIEFVGCNSNAKMVTLEKSIDYTMHYTGITGELGAKTYRYKKVTYIDIYPGIDVEFRAQTGNEKPVEYNFIVHPGADMGSIKMRYTGANKAELTNNKIILSTQHGNLVESIPASWMAENNQAIGVEYRKIDGTDNSLTIGFNGEYNGINTLIIDPTPNLEWGTFYGGASSDIGRSIVTDKSGNVYLTGGTLSTSGISTTGSHQSNIARAGLKDVFLSKYSASGSLLWATYMGGSGSEEGFGVCIDDIGNIYIAGNTTSDTGMSTVGAYKTSKVGDEIFIAKFSNSGTRIWSTYYGSNGDEYCNGISLDPSGNIFIVGFQDGVGLGTNGTHQKSNAGKNDAFLAKFSNSGFRIWGTYYGGDFGDDYGNAVTTDASGNVFITGNTNSSSGISTPGAFKPSISWANDVFIAKFSGTGGALLWGTYYGASQYDAGYGITTDINDNVLVTGVTTNGGSSNPNEDAFIAKFSNVGKYIWDKDFGAKFADYAYGICTDLKGNVIITGGTNNSADLATSGASQTIFGGWTDAFVAKFSANGSIFWATYFGGTLEDKGQGVCTDTIGNVFITGYAKSTNGISTTGAHQASSGGNEDIFIAKFSGPSTLQPEIDIYGNNTIIINGSTAVKFGDSTNFGLSVNTVQYKIKNTGTDTLKIANIRFSKADSSEFSISAMPTENILRGDSSFFTVKFNAGNKGVKTTHVLIANNDADENPFSFAIKAESPILSNQNIMNSALQFQVYPNPSEGIFTMNWYSSMAQKTVLTVSNVNGQVVHSQTFTSLVGEQTKKLDLRHLQSGVYIIQFMDKSKKISIY